MSTGGAGWQAPPRTEEAAAIHAAAEADRRARPERYRLDPEEVAAAAAGDQGTADFAPGWETGLAAYLGSAEEDGRLSALGRRMVRAAATARLRAGAALARHLRAHPEVLDRPLLPPIVIVGGWRTGTTFLFRLLATDPRLRAPLPLELSAPLKVAGRTPAERDAIVDAAAGTHELLHTLNPALRAIHDSGARLPEECVLALGTDLRSWGFPSTTRLDGYAAWLAGEDLGPGYERYRHQLQLLDDQDGRRWVLKAPAHTAELDRLVAAFPGAIVVHLHRDIVETVASGASLFATFRSTYSDEVDGADVGRFQADTTELWLRRAVTFREAPAAAAATWVDVAYPDLVAAPTAVLDRIWAAADLDPVADPGAFVEAHHAAQPRHAHGAHRYSAADFGLDAQDLRERFAFYEAFAAERTAR